MAKRKPGEFEIGPAAKMQKKYGWYAENRPTIRVEPAEVPSHLRAIIPVVERWAIACDVTRHDYFAKQSDDDLRELARVVAPHNRAINTWLDSLPGGVAAWPPAAVHFLYVLKAWNEAACEFPDECELADPA